MIKRFSIVLFFFSSCVNHKSFTTYKSQLLSSSGNGAFIKTEGLYYSKTSNLAYYFFKNGLVKIYENPSDSVVFWINPAIEAKKLFDTYLSTYWDKENWGHYNIEGDSLYIQTFSIYIPGSFRRCVIEHVGTINNNKSFQLHYKKNCLLNKYQNGFEYQTKFIHPLNLDFFQTEMRPDSSNSWFLTKKWYREGLHPSRR